MIKGGLPTEAMVAHVLASKYAWHLPLYRQAQMLKSPGVVVERMTLASWVGYAAAELAPVVARLREILLGSVKLAVDETPVPVLDPGRGRTKIGYFWSMARDDRPWGNDDPPAVAYSYAPGRGAEQAIKLLAGYSGIVQCDGYAAYKQLADGRRSSGPATLAFCWAHWRRRFYAIEKTIRGRSAAERLTARQAQSKPLVDALKVWLEGELARVSGKSVIAAAIRYGLKHWDGLVRFLADGRIEMDTNAVERAIRPVAMTESFYTSSSSICKH